MDANHRVELDLKVMSLVCYRYTNSQYMETSEGIAPSSTDLQSVAHLSIPTRLWRKL